jgi:hypothetical protein
LRELFTTTNSHAEKPRPTALFGVISLLGVVVSIALFAFGGLLGLLPAIGLSWVLFFVAFVCAVIALFRWEKPIWPALVGGLVSLAPGVLFITGLANWLSRWLLGALAH